MPDDSAKFHFFGLRLTLAERQLLAELCGGRRGAQGQLLRLLLREEGKRRGFTVPTPPAISVAARAQRARRARERARVTRE